MNSKMKRLIHFTLITMLFITLLSGISVYAKTSKGDPEKEALVFGCIDLAEVNSNLTNMDFLKYEGPRIGIGKLINMYDYYDNGLFIADRVIPGQYWLMNFSIKKLGFQLRQEPTICTITNKPAEADMFTVNQGDIYFFGTYKYQVVKKAGMFSRGQYTLEKADSPSEKELLQMVLEKLQGSKWEAKIQERLANL